MPEFTPTPSQRDAIQTLGASLIVSAGAGSGKTAALAERCAYLVADAVPPCPIDQLLVVTFTDAAATEMRQRIEKVLRSRLAARPADRRLQEQIALLDTASISTIHSFCRRVLNRYFAQADLDPMAPVLDPREAELLRQETARSLFDRLADRPDEAGEAFLNLLSAYGGANERQLLETVLGVDAFLTSLPDPSEWVRSCVGRYAPAAGGGLPDFWVTEFFAGLRAELAEQRHTVDLAMREIISRPHPLIQEFEVCIGGYEHALRAWSGRADLGNTAEALESLCQEIDHHEFADIPRLRPERKSWSSDEQAALQHAKDLAHDIRDNLFRRRLKVPFGGFSVAAAKEGFDRTRGHLSCFLAVVETLRKEFQSAKRDLGVVDFSDLERFTLDLLGDESLGVAARLRDQYRHVLVDEFQDVNPLQARILSCISREGETRAANLFTVGDVKQSIYRFRLAEPRLFLDRRESFRPIAQAGDAARGLRVDLIENFRSRPGVLDAINAIFERIMAPDLGGIAYDEHARLKATRKEESAYPSLELHILDKAGGADDSADGDPQGEQTDAMDWEQIEREAHVIAHRIQELVKSGVAHRDIVILLRSMQPRAALFIRRLLQMNVPVVADMAGGIFQSLEVMDVLAVLQLLDNFQQDIPLAALLRCPVMGRPLTDDELVEIRTSARAVGTPFHDAVQRYAKSGRRAELQSVLAGVLARLDLWRQRARRRPLADVLWQIYEESGYLAYVCGLRDGSQCRANLLRLHEYTRQFGGFTRQGLYRFLRFIDDLRDSDLDLEAGSAHVASQDVVRVMTIHRSKGLEFPVVFVGELGKRFNFADSRGNILYDRRLGVAMEAVDLEKRVTYPTLPHRLVSNSVKTETLAEELRILYVALTRAKERLILVGTTALSTVDEARARWAGHVGPLPLLDRQAAQSAIDWVGKAVCCIDSNRVAWNEPDTSRLFLVRTHAAADMKKWEMEQPIRADASKWLAKVTRLEPLDEGPSSNDPAHDAVELVKRRLTTPYLARLHTQVPSVVAASALKRRWNASTDPEEAPNVRDASSLGTQTRFPGPSWVAGPGEIDAAERGTWTHEFLQRIDLTRPCDEGDLRAQLGEWVLTARVEPRWASQIDLPALAWFFASDLGSRLRDKNARVLREHPFVLGVDPARYDPAARPLDEGDVVLVRGIIDCLFDAGAGWEILDYKTDAVSGEALTRRAEEYRGQLAIYAAAVEASWKKPVKKRWLVFLSPREVVEI